MSTKPRYTIRRHRSLYSFTGRSYYYCLDNKDMCYVFINVTWPEVLEWLNGKAA